VNEVRAEVVVHVDPRRAFSLFTAEVDRWWRRGERYGGPEVRGHRFEPGVGGRFLEISAAGPRSLGRITAWDPPRRLAFTWRQGNWRASELTEVTVTFDPVSDGTRVRLRHSGFDFVVSEIGCDLGYRAGWRELLGWYREAAHRIDKEAVCT
jgi:uncharacterized protein YndB with AHSA1/START domain